MGKASQAKKVNRAAATGGGRTSGAKTPVGWYSALFLVVVLGVVGVFMASKNISDNQAAAGVTPPTKKDHWHAAYGFNLCGKWVDPLEDGPRGDSTGIHTHKDGLIHTHPFLDSVTGKNATFDKLMTDTATKVSATAVDLKREGEKFKNGDKCGKKAGKLTWRVFKNEKDKTGKLMKGNPGEWRIAEGSIIAVSFNAEGFKLEQPPSTPNLADPKDLGDTPVPTPTESTTAEGDTTETTTAEETTPTTEQ